MRIVFITHIGDETIKNKGKRSRLYDLNDRAARHGNGDIMVNPVVVEEPPREPITCSVSSMGLTSVVITWASFNDASREGF
jgi:hypothetical protein